MASAWYNVWHIAKAPCKRWIDKKKKKKKYYYHSKYFTANKINGLLLTHMENQVIREIILSSWNGWKKWGEWLSSKKQI